MYGPTVIAPSTGGHARFPKGHHLGSHSQPAWQSQVQSSLTRFLREVTETGTQPRKYTTQELSCVALCLGLHACPIPTSLGLVWDIKYGVFAQ